MKQIITLMVWLAVAGFAGYQFGVNEIIAKDNPTSKSTAQAIGVRPEAKPVVLNPEVKQTIKPAVKVVKTEENFDLNTHYYSGDEKVAITNLGFDYEKIKKMIDFREYKRAAVRPGEMILKIATNDKIIRDYIIKEIQEVWVYKTGCYKGIIYFPSNSFWAVK